MSQPFWNIKLQAVSTPGSDLIPGGRLKAEQAPSLITNEARVRIWVSRIGERPLAVKVYCRRSPVDAFAGKAFRYRVQREYEELNRLKNASVPCTLPVFWGTGRSPQEGRFEVLATHYIHDALSLKERLGEKGEHLTPMGIERLFRLVRRVHAAGVFHGALSWKNILTVRNGAGHLRFFIMDMAKSVHFSRDLFRSRAAGFDLRHLSRYLLQGCGGKAVGAGLRAYGLSRGEACGLLDSLASYRPTRHLRNRLQAEFKLRALWMRWF